jgi:hypothetical protein
MEVRLFGNVSPPDPMCVWVDVKRTFVCSDGAWRGTFKNEDNIRLNVDSSGNFSWNGQISQEHFYFINAGHTELRTIVPEVFCIREAGVFALQFDCTQQPEGAMRFRHLMPYGVWVKYRCKKEQFELSAAQIGSRKCSICGRICTADAHVMHGFGLRTKYEKRLFSSVPYIEPFCSGDWTQNLVLCSECCVKLLCTTYWYQNYVLFYQVLK